MDNALETERRLTQLEGDTDRHRERLDTIDHPENGMLARIDRLRNDHDGRLRILERSMYALGGIIALVEFLVRLGAFK